MSHAIDWEISVAKNLAELASILRKIELPINRLKQIELWMEIRLLDSEQAALLVEQGYLFNRRSGDEE